MGNQQGQEQQAQQNPSDQKAANPFNKPKEEKCILNVYEPADARQSGGAAFGFGVYHTGLEVYGTEYMFAGGAGQSGSGIHTQAPRVMHEGSPWKYLKSVELGTTTMTRWEIQDIISKMGSEFPASSYNIMARNCNHFTDAFSKRITKAKTGIPSWVNRTASLGNAFFGPAGGGAPAAAPKVETPPSVFQTGKGYTLDGSAAAPGKKAKTDKPTDAKKDRSSGSAGSSAEKRNPWRDPNFMPGAKKADDSSSPLDGDSRPASASLATTTTARDAMRPGSASVSTPSSSSAIAAR
jgi:hypothetical protein